MAVDDHSRAGFTDLYPDETKGHATQFLENAVAYYKSLGVSLRRVLTDNGPALPLQGVRRSLRPGGHQAQVHLSLPAPDQRQGRAFHPIGAAGVGYGFAYNNSSERAELLERWIHHYNWHRLHQRINGIAPISHLRSSRNNLLTLHSQLHWTTYPIPTNQRVSSEG